MASCTQQPFVLVIDDNHDSADLMVELLQACGYSSAAAYGGASGLEAIRNFSPDVVLLDLLMPEVDGFQVASQIRKPDFPHQPVLIAFSALNDTATINLAMRSGFDYHLPKPATIKQVITVIANARSRKQNPTPAFANPGEGSTPAAGEVPPAFIYKSGF